MNKAPLFHLAIPVNDLAKARHFYTHVLQLEEGRSDKNWVDYNFFGHQLVIHYKASENEEVPATNPVDGKAVPVPHFGVILEWDDFSPFADRLRAANIQFVIEPYIRFEGEVGEQWTMFFMDPCNNALEFKAFKNPTDLFAK